MAATVWQSSPPPSPDADAADAVHTASPLTASPFSTPPRAPTPMSRLPRCAVVNFRKDGTSLAWKPRLSQNVGGLAARVHNFEDAFVLEEFSSRALPTPQSLQFERQQQRHFASSLAAATKLNVDAPKSLRIPPQHTSAFQRARGAANGGGGGGGAADSAAAGAAAAAHRQTALRNSGNAKRSALSFFKRMLQRERRNRRQRRRAVDINSLRPRPVVQQQPNTVSYHQRGGGGGGADLAHACRKMSDSTVTDESDQSGSPQMAQPSAAAGDDGRLRFEKKSKSVWRANYDASPTAAKRRVRSSLAGRPLPSLRRRVHKHSEMGGGANGSDDPYVRFITSVM